MTCIVFSRDRSQKEKCRISTLAAGTWPSTAIRNNGPESLAFERFKLREVVEGWPMYHDSAEWENFESIFAEGAFVYTSWTGRIGIKVSLFFELPPSRFALQKMANPL